MPIHIAKTEILRHTKITSCKYVKSCLTFKISQLLTDYDVIGNGIEHAIDISCTVTKDTCDLELYVTFASADGRKLSHTEMIAEGLLKQSDFDELSKTIADAARETPDFKRDGFLTLPIN